MSQTSVPETLQVGLAGQKFGLGPFRINSHINNSKQLDLVTVDLAENTTTYTVTINGTDFDFLSDGSATDTEISAGLQAAIAGGSEPVTAVDLDGSLTIQADVAGTVFTIAVSDDGAGTDLSIANQITNQQTVEFGLFVVKDADAGQDDKVHLPYAAAHITGNRAAGFALRDIAVEQSRLNADNKGFEFQSEMPVLREGQCYVEMEDAFTNSDSVFIRFATGSGGTKLGAARTDADTTTAAQLASATIENSGSAGELAIITINKP